MTLRIEQFGHARRVTLAEPDHRNTLTASLASDLLRELAQAESDPDTRAILLDAEGDVFCGGLDAARQVPDELFDFGCRMVKPVVASVQGVAISAGLALVANAHVAVAAQGSSFGLTDIRDGHCHPPVLQAVARAIGMRRAQELALTGRIFSTPEALAWGLIHVAAPPFELDDRATAIATGLANANSEVVRAVLGAGRR
jgi:enoyl-CoA hydratase/carnithine racemase